MKRRRHLFLIFILRHDKIISCHINVVCGCFDNYNTSCQMLQPSLAYWLRIIMII